MIFKDFKKKVKEIGIPVAEAEFSKAKDPPFIAYLRDADNSIYADGMPIYTNIQLTVELYTEKDDCDSEVKIEEWFKSNKISFSKKERIWISSEKFYVTIYRVTLL